jgi:hypothetical protein
MGIQSFTPSSGGLPGLEYINQVLLSTATRSWAQGGGAGTYTIRSAKGEAGYVYFVGATTVGGPLNGIIEVPASFTSIKLIGAIGDLASLYKVTVKPTTSFSTTATYTTYTSTATNLTLASNKTGFIDALLVGGGAGRGQHGGGGGAGGVLLLNSFPLSPTSAFNVQVGSHGANSSAGGDTIFAGTRAPGGGAGSDDSTGVGFPGGSGGGGSNAVGGASTQGSGVAAVANPILFYSSYGSVATANGHGFQGGPGGGTHNGGGGGGAGGAGASAGHGNGGSGILLNFTGTPTYYAAGGSGSRHSPATGGNNGTGWSSSGYGMGGQSHPTSVSNAPQGTAGVVIVRSYDF